MTRALILALILSAPILAQAVPAPMPDPYSPAIAAAAVAQRRLMCPECLAPPADWSVENAAEFAQNFADCSNPKLVNVQDVVQIEKCQNFVRILWTN
jgi:hypothetical protein